MTKIRRLVVITIGLLVLLLALAGEGMLAGGPGGKWSLTGSMHKDREGHSAILLGNREVLVAGGISVVGPGSLTSAELFVPGT